MTSADKIKYKQKLHRHAIDIIQKRIAASKTAMDNAQAGANAEEKSSAGDKYETARAMGQLEKDMHAGQLMANKQELAALLNIDSNKLYDSVSTGSVVVCDNLSFFIASGLGKISIEEKDIYFLSPAAPLAKLLLNKIVADLISFNKKEMIIMDIF